MSGKRKVLKRQSSTAAADVDAICAPCTPEHAAITDGPSRRTRRKEHLQYLEHPPDGGWGWLVVFSSFLMHIVVIASIKSFGVFYPVFREAFNEAPIACALSKLTSCRVMVSTGGVLAAVGLIISSFASSVTYLLFSLGILTGFAMSLMYSPCLTMVGRYFDKKRATANGIGLSGNGVLIDEYSYHGALLVIAAITLHGCVCGALLRPIRLREDLEQQALMSKNHRKTPNNSTSHCNKCVSSTLYMAFYGVFSGVFHSLIAVLVREYTGVARLFNGIGWTLLAGGTAYLLGAPIAGWLYDATGNYNISFFSAGSIIVSSLILLCLKKPRNPDGEHEDGDSPSPQNNRESLSDVKEVPPPPQDLEKWEDSHKVIASDCQNKYGDETCKKFTDHRFHLMPQFQYFMACSCAKASGICTTALATPAPTLQAIDDEDEECLRLQNEKRSQHGAAPLVWCQECADFAKTVVQTMQDLNEPLHHTSPEERTWLVEGKEVLHGSNLQYEFPHIDCVIAVESWYSETEFYDPDRPVESLEQAGHFTQMVWKDTKSVGCAWTENYLACIYEPTGNTENAYDIERNVQP
ncbi:hypothetical protein Bbelb_100700 [Branchiostoma belcheri]|nr:hypothetical protein Bbelb_100700 [Branchiostoma belcheri]